MLWYDGSIESAVRKVKSTGSFLLVFVQGEGSLSREYESCLNRVTGLKDGTYVAIKLARDSTALQQFKQIYVKVPVPSVFLIQNNGIPFHVVATDKVSEICSGISKICKFAKENKVEDEKAATQSTKKSRKIDDVSDDVLKHRLNEIRAFPRFLLIDPSSNLDPAPVSAPPRQPPKTHSARIQFRLPNNETPSWEFPDLATLRDVRAYVTEKVDIPPNFNFMRAYPRTTFSPRDECRTLSDLSLTPNATLIVVPVKAENKKIQANASDSVSRPFFLSAVLNALLLPVLTLIKFFKKHIFGERREMDDDENEPTRYRAVRQNRNSRKLASNIHGFKFDRDDSDGEHPDNGNSTQQSYHKK